MRPLSLLLLALAIGCGSEPAAPAPAPAPAAAPAPAPEPAKAEPAKKAEPAGPANAENGKVVYDTYCKACHQDDGTGMNGMLAANFNEEGRLDKSDEELLKSIRDGYKGQVGLMPPWGETLTEQEMVDVLAHVRASYGKKAE